MAQPRILRSSGRTIAKFGGQALPNGQGAMGQLDLNDYVNTLLVNQFESDDDNRQIGLAQLLYRARGLYTSDDFGPRTLTLPMMYLEDATHFLGGFLAALSQAGEQQLTFDNATYILAKYKGISGRKPARPSLQPPHAWEFNLQLLARSPWFQDAAATVTTPAGTNPITVDAGVNFNITYAGSVFCEPVWTLVVPVGNGVPINSMQLRGTMPGEFLTVNFLSVAPLPAATSRTVTIDCGAMTVTDNVGNNYDVSGSFPMLYPPAGQVNPFTVIITPASGSSTGLTLACSHFPRWQI